MTPTGGQISIYQLMQQAGMGTIQSEQAATGMILSQNGVTDAKTKTPLM